MSAMELIWKATAILLAAFAATAALRSRPAALRHFIWTAAFAALLALPVAALVVPRWSPLAPTASPLTSSISLLITLIVPDETRRILLCVPI